MTQEKFFPGTIALPRRWTAFAFARVVLYYFLLNQEEKGEGKKAWFSKQNG